QPSVNLKQRPYFQGIQAGERWSIEGSDGFLVHPGRSIVDGQFRTFLAIPSRIKDVSGARPVTALMSLDLRSGDRQPIPAGYSFAVVNREGHALYENDPRRALREDFLEEVEQTFRLSAALQGDGNRTISLTYRTKPHRFYLRPLRELRMSSPYKDWDSQPGWFLMVYRDLSGPHTIAARAVVLSLLYAIGSLLVLGVLMLAIMRRVSAALFKGHIGAWLWPLEGGSYRGLAIANALLLGAGIACLAWFDGMALAFLSILFSLLAPCLWVVWLHGQSRKCRPTDPRTFPKKAELWQSDASVFFLICYPVPLASGLFKFFGNDEIGRFQHSQQLDRLERRRELETAAKRENGCQEGGNCPRANSEIRYKLDIPTADQPGPTRQAGWLPEGP